MMSMKYRVAAVLLFAVSSAQAHIVLQQKSAPAGSYYRATFQVSHGCDGSPTRAISVELPAELASVKPMPKPGWNIAIETAKPSKPLSLHGKPVESVVRRITWSGGPLPDAYYDEFVMQMKLPDEAGRLAFKVRQLCEQGESNWVEIPAEGGAMPAFPAPALDVVMPDPHAGHMH